MALPLKDLDFDSETERIRFTEWTGRIAEALDGFGGPGAYDEAVEKLVGSPGQDGTDGYTGQLSSGDDGFPVFYANTVYEPDKTNDLVHFLYGEAFDPVEATEKKTVRTETRLTVYARVYDEHRGEANCAGILTARRARYGDPEVEILPDTLLFNASYIYIKDLVCESEEDLLELYRNILSCRV